MPRKTVVDWNGYTPFWSTESDMSGEYAHVKAKIMATDRDGHVVNFGASSLYWDKPKNQFIHGLEITCQISTIRTEEVPECYAYKTEFNAESLALGNHVDIDVAERMFKTLQRINKAYDRNFNRDLYGEDYPKTFGSYMIMMAKAVGVVDFRIANPDNRSSWLRDITYHQVGSPKLLVDRLVNQTIEKNPNGYFSNVPKFGEDYAKGLA